MRRFARIGLQLVAVTCAFVFVLSGARALPQGTIPDVPRNRTFISAGWDVYSQVPAPTNFSPYNGVLLNQRNVFHYTLYEMLFYTNYNSGRIIPWLGESWQYNKDYTGLTIKVRHGAKWSDGQAFTARDVVFTLNMLKQAAPALPLSGDIAATVQDAKAVDPYTVQITLKAPAPRWALQYLVDGQTARLIVVPEHIWRGQDPKTFTFYDPAKGWPVGTGPFHLVRTGADAMIFDRRATWWAVDAGLAKQLPAIQRIIYRPAPIDAQPQLYINNDIDTGFSLEPGVYGAARGRNPNLVTWRDRGPAWGVASGCVYRLIFNNQKPPFDDRDVRWAFDHAVDRQQIVDLAYERSTRPVVAPFASYAAIELYLKPLQSLFAKYDVDNHDIGKTAALLTAKGFKKGPDGYWMQPNGQRWPITIITQQGDPIGPVITQQLKTAGFDAVLRAPQYAAFLDVITSGTFETAVWVHCGSDRDPWETLEHFQSKYTLPPGQKISNIRAPGRYANPEFDALIDQMSKMAPSFRDPKYMDLVSRATEIILRDQPELDLAEELHVVTFNTTYWKGYPNAADPYMAPFMAWEGFDQIINRLTPSR